MNKLIVSAVALALIAGSVTVADAASSSRKTSAQKQAMIRKSVAAYKGSCPCPWSTMRNGRRCGGNSAWSKPGGAQPLCYESDIK